MTNCYWRRLNRGLEQAPVVGRSCPVPSLGVGWCQSLFGRGTWPGELPIGDSPDRLRLLSGRGIAKEIET